MRSRRYTMPRKHISHPVVGLALTAGICIVGCESPTPPPRQMFVPPSVQLVSPEPEGRFRQNDPTLSCLPHSARGSGFRVAFDWKDVRGATRYRVVFWHRNAQFPAIEREVTASEYEEIDCNAFVIDNNLNDWVWKVAAMGPIPTKEFDTGAFVRDTVLWSQERVYGFQPCRLSDGQPCYAPPAAGRLAQD